MKNSTIKGQSQIKNSRNRLITFTQTFQSSMIEKGEKFGLDKTLVKGIKQNDPSKIIENGQQADLGNTNQIYDEQKQVNGMLVETRKKYDQIKQTTNKIQEKIQKLKKDKQTLQTQKSRFEQMIKDEQNQFKNIQLELESLNNRCQSIQYAKDIRVQISETLKHDILFYKKNCFEANIKIVRNQNKIKNLTNQFDTMKKVSSNCKTLVYSIEKKIHDKQHQRVDKINSYYDVLNRKLENNSKKLERSRIIENSILEALVGKLPSQIQQQKLLLTNMMLKKMLKFKMEKQMQNFNQVQTAFKIIQQNTTIKKTDQFVSRFLQKERHLGELLQSISKSQQKINRLKLQKQALEKQNQDILHQKQTLHDLQMQKKGKVNDQDNQKIDVLRQKLLHNERLKNKIKIFASKFISNFDQKNVEEVKTKLKKEKPHLCLQKILQRTNKYLDQIQRQDSQQKINEIYMQLKGISLPTTVRTKNLRIKTLTTREQTQNSAMEDHDILYDDLSQQDYFNHNRRQVKKSIYLRNRLKTKAC